MNLVYRVLLVLCGSMLVACGDGASAPGGSGGSGGTAGTGGGPPSLTPPPADNPTDVRRLDLRVFDSFRIEQNDGPEACPDPNQVASALFTRLDQGFLLEFVRFVPAGDFDTCIEQSDEPQLECYDTLPGEPRTLSEFEMLPLEGLFTSLTVHFAQDPECEDFPIAPCRIVSMAWDDLEAGDLECDPPWLSGIFADGILQTVSDLALAPSN